MLLEWGLMVKFLAEILAESSVTNYTAHEVAEPAKWLLKGGRNTPWFPDFQTKRTQIKST